MKTIDDIIKDILRREGGFVNRNEDRGGPTNIGITQAALSHYLEREASIDDVRDITPDLAREIYERAYIAEPHLDTLPALIQPAMVDAAVHSGPRRAVAWLQEVLNQAGFGPVNTDGVIGLQTREAAFVAVEQMGMVLVKALVEQRRMFLHRLIAADPRQQIFAKGWDNRLNELECVA